MTAWPVLLDQALKYDEAGNLLSANLDLKNPNAAETIEHLPPQELVADIIKKERQILNLMAEIEQALRR
jgi:type I restriction enzyme M protein